MEYHSENKEFDKLLEFMGMIKFAYESQTSNSLIIRDSLADESFKNDLNFNEYVPTSIFKFRYKEASWRIVGFKYSPIMLFQVHAITAESSNNHYYQVLCIKDFSNRVEIEEVIEVNDDYVRRRTGQCYYRDIIQIQYTNKGFELRSSFPCGRNETAFNLFSTNEKFMLSNVGESAQIIAKHLTKMPLDGSKLIFDLKKTNYIVSNTADTPNNTKQNTFTTNDELEELAKKTKRDSFYIRIFYALVFCFLLVMVILNYSTNHKNETQQALTPITIKESNLRSSPAKGNNIISTIPKGSSVTVLEKNGEWLKVRFNNTEGYVKDNLVSATH